MRIIYTYGVWDLFHYGHLQALKKLRKMTDNLFVGVFTDKVATSFKRKPIMKFNERFKLIKMLGEYMDFSVIEQDSLDPNENYETLSNIFSDDYVFVAKGKGAGFEKYDRKNYILMPYTKGISTSKIINRIKKCK